MDYWSLGIACCIAGYGVVEYRLREQRHRKVLGQLRRGEEPSVSAPAGKKFRLLTTAAVGLLLLVSAALMVWYGSGIPRYGRSIVLIGLLFAVLALPVLTMFVRDLRTRRIER